MREGLEKVIPSNALALMSWSDLETSVCGHGVTRQDFLLLQKKTTYSSHRADSQVVKWLWRYLLDDATDEERAAYVQFTWGRTRLPATVEDYERNHLIQGHSSCRGNAASDNLLPKSHTCGFAFDLPQVRFHDFILSSHVVFCAVSIVRSAAPACFVVDPQCRNDGR